VSGPAYRYDDPETALNCGSILRDCIRSESIAKWAPSGAPVLPSAALAFKAPRSVPEDP